MIDASLIDPDRPDRRTMAVRGLVTLTVLVMIGAVLLAIGRGTFAGSVPVTARVDDAGGSLGPGADVKLDGVIVGSVTSVGDGADERTVDLQVTLEGDAATAVPADVTARVLPATVFGTTFVDLLDASEGAGTADAIAAGAVVEQDTSTETLELQTALDSSERILTAVEPAELSVTLGALADALDGRGEKLGATIDTLGTYLERLEPQVPLLREDLRLLAQNMQTLADVAPELLDATEDGLVTARTISEGRAELTALIGGGSALISETQDVLDAVEQPFVQAMAQSAVVVQAMFDEREGLPRSLTSFIDFADRQSTTFAEGSYMSTDVHIEVGDAEPYTAQDCPRYGAASGPRCAAPEGPAGGADDGGDPDAALVAELRSVLDALQESEQARPDGVGALLARPYLDGANR